MAGGSAISAGMGSLPSRRRWSTEREGLTFGQPAVRGHIACLEPVARGLRRDAVEQEFVAGIRPLDRHLPSGLRLQRHLQPRRAAGVVEVAMRQHDAFHGDAGLLDGVEDAVDVPTGVDDHGNLGRLIPQDGAILLEWRHRNDGAAQAGRDRISH
jgi:hypothetical protein